ncbi:hypothetical protein GIB67_016866, partial [Kingdonia uniflora]
CRPLTLQEASVGATMAIDFDSAKDGELTINANGAPKKIFKTGTGKTFAMEGSKDASGVNYTTLEELFNIIMDQQELFKYEISVNALEVYNEQIRDLLVPGSQSGLTSKRASNMNEVWDVQQTGSNARVVEATNANEHSSRSHCIHCVMVKGENLMNGECTIRKLWLVDLVGTERVAKTDAQGDRLKEAQNISRSLSALGDVISLLQLKAHISLSGLNENHTYFVEFKTDSPASGFLGCNSYERAKKLTVVEAPNIPEFLNLAPYMSGSNDKSPIYKLYVVVVHLDVMNAAFSGHYLCYVRNIEGKWFKIDDSKA